MIDELIPLIEDLESQGAVVILKWDGERSTNTKSVVIMRNDTGFSCRTDTDDFTEGFLSVLEEYKKHHEKGD
ncbi:hypothetical protein [Zooshikella sp. RANM57]|uniref:hypothetical protein n=1 Tax=Zooshikella sp. RANM57 TaxID=3425863 RepID=UPI003D6F5B25